MSFFTSTTPSRRRLRAAGLGLAWLTLTLGFSIPGGPMPLRDYSYLDASLLDVLITPGLLLATITAAVSTIALACATPLAAIPAILVSLFYLLVMFVHGHHEFVVATHWFHQVLSVLEMFDVVAPLAVIYYALRGLVLR